MRYPNHSREFWQLYEDVCISEGVLLERALGDRKSLRELKIEKIIKMTKCANKSFME